MTFFSFRLVFPLLRLLLVSISILGIMAHTAGLVSYFCWKSNVFGMNFLSHIVKATMARLMAYNDLNQFEGHMKAFVEGGGILACVLLFRGAWKRSAGYCVLYVLYTVLYLLGVFIHLELLRKLWILGVRSEKFMKEIVPAVVTASFGIFGILVTILFMIVIWMRKEEFNQKFNLMSTGSMKSSEIPTISGEVEATKIP